MSTSPIGDIASIRMGVTLRGRDATRPDPHGSCRMIRISEISDDGVLSSDDLLQFEPGDPVKPDHFLRPGDILFPNRGLRTTAAVFELPESNVIVGAQFFILRVNPKIALPAYAAWFLRSDTAAAHFGERRKGTLVQTLQRRDIEELAIPLPPLSRQSTIVALDALAREERRLSSELLRLRSNYLQHRLLLAASHS
jgi:restriction endonuclease S subunit